MTNCIGGCDEFLEAQEKAELFDVILYLMSKGEITLRANVDKEYLTMFTPFYNEFPSATTQLAWGKTIKESLSIMKERVGRVVG
jgi:hypothetical protein